MEEVLQGNLNEKVHIMGVRGATDYEDTFKEIITYVAEANDAAILI